MHITIEYQSLKELEEFVSRVVVLKSAIADRKNDPEFDVRPKPAQKRTRKSVDINEIWALKKQGMTAKDIADKLGIGYSTVCAKLNKVT